MIKRFSKPIYFVVCIITSIVIYTSCKKDPGNVVSTDDNNPVTPPVVTTCPVAKAGPDITITLPQSFLTLDGSGSYDSLNRPLTYEWQLFSASQPLHMTSHVSKPLVSGFKQGNYSFQLKVTAGNCTSFDTVNVTVLGAIYCQQNREEIPVQLNPLVALPAYVQWPRLLATNNKLIVIPMDMFSQPSVYIYDQVNLQWTSTQLSNVREGMSIFAAGTKIYFAGGLVYDNNYNVIATTRIDIYDLLSQTWIVRNLSEPRAFVKGIALEDQLFFAGGMKSDRTFSNKMDIYDISSNTWSAAILPGTPRAIIGATTANNKLFFCGGYTEFVDYTGFGEVLNKAVKDIDIYDPVSGAWTQDAMHVAKDGFATFSFDNKLYLAGGIIDANQDAYPETLDFTVEIKELNSSINSFACIFQPNTYGSGNVTEKNNQLVFIGDNTYSTTVSGKIDIYNTQNGNWKIGLLPPNMMLDSYAASVVAVNNQIYVVYQGSIYTMNF